MENQMTEVFLNCMREWIHVPGCKSGEHLFHYTNLSAMKGIVTEQSVWVTKSDFLNDKFEFQYAYKVIKNVCSRIMPNPRIRKQFTKMFKQRAGVLMNDIMGQVLSGWYVLSFSSESDSLLLWTEFSQSQGYCIEFDYDRLLQGLGNRIFLNGYVIYEKELQEHMVEDTLMRVVVHLIQKNRKWRDLENLFSEKGDVSEESLCQVMNEFVICGLVYSMFFKKESFAQEAEYRFVFWALHEESAKGNAGQITPMHFRTQDQVMIPYIIVDYKQKEGHNPIEGITVGPKNNSDLAVKGVQYFLKNEKIEIPVRQSQIPLRY